MDESGVLRHWAADGRPLRRCFLSDLETLWAFAPGAAVLASGNDDLLLWDTADGQLVQRLPADAWVTAVAFSPDGQTLASGHDDGTVRVWDVASRQKVGQIQAHPQPDFRRSPSTRPAARWPPPAKTGPSACGTSTRISKWASCSATPTASPG